MLNVVLEELATDSVERGMPLNKKNVVSVKPMSGRGGAAMVPKT